MVSTKYDPIIFCQKESLNREDFIIATYWAKADTADILMRAGAMAVEQTTGTWIRVPDETDEVRRGHVGRVINVFNIPGYELDCPEPERSFIMQIAFPWENIGQQLPELLATVFGNISMSKDLKLLDLEFPKSFTDGFHGPRFGVKGIREITGCIDRPPVLAMIKPCTGIPIPVIEKQLEKLCRAGIDMVKDDELIADPAHAPFHERVKACLAVCERVYQETGHRTIYIPNITDRQDKALQKAHWAVENGARALMVNIHASGYGLMGALAEDDSINVPLLAHPAYAGAAYTSPYGGMSSTLIFGKFMRLEGADIVVYPCAYGKVPALKDRYIRSAQSMLSEFNGMKNTFPSPAAGLNPGMVPAIMDDLGEDVILGAGAAMHAHPMGLKAGVDALHQAAESWLRKIPIREYAKEHPELQAAIDIWGVYDPNKSIFELTK